MIASLVRHGNTKPAYWRESLPYICWDGQVADPAASKDLVGEGYLSSDTLRDRTSDGPYARARRSYALKISEDASVSKLRARVSAIAALDVPPGLMGHGRSVTHQRLWRQMRRHLKHLIDPPDYPLGGTMRRYQQALRGTSALADYFLAAADPKRPSHGRVSDDGLDVYRWLRRLYDRVKSHDRNPFHFAAP